MRGGRFVVGAGMRSRIVFCVERHEAGVLIAFVWQQRSHLVRRSRHGSRIGT